MTASNLLAELDALGVELDAPSGAGDRLRYRPRDKVSRALVERIRAHKTGLLDLVKRRKTAARLRDVAGTWPVAWRDFWEERAAILEHEAHLPRDVAEDRAYQLLMTALLAGQGVDYTPGSVPTAAWLGAT